MLCRRESPEARAISQEYVSVDETGHLRRTSPCAVGALGTKRADKRGCCKCRSVLSSAAAQAQSKAVGEVILAVNLEPFCYCVPSVLTVAGQEAIWALMALILCCRSNLCSQVTNSLKTGLLGKNFENIQTIPVGLHVKTHIMSNQDNQQYIFRNMKLLL
jgi:hypothetical protein